MKQGSGAKHPIILEATGALPALICPLPKWGEDKRNAQTDNCGDSEAMPLFGEPLELRGTAVLDLLHPRLR